MSDEKFDIASYVTSGVNCYSTSVLIRFSRWLEDGGRRKSTIRAYCLEVRRFFLQLTLNQGEALYADRPVNVPEDGSCEEAEPMNEQAVSRLNEPLISRIYEDCLLQLQTTACRFTSGIKKYVYDNNVSASTRLRRYQAIVVFLKFLNLEIPLKRPVLDISKSSKGKRETCGNQRLDNSAPVELLDISARSLKNNRCRLKLKLNCKVRLKGRWELALQRNRALTLLAVLHGVTVAELAELKIDAVNVAGTSVFLKTAAQTIKLNPVVREAVLEYLVAREARGFQSFRLFVSFKGRDLSVRTIQHGIKSYLIDCGTSPVIASARKARRVYCEMIKTKSASKVLKVLSR